MKKKKMYLCVGENFKEGAKMGYCGDVYSLEKWLEILFPHANAAEYFKNDPVNEVLDYIFKNCGKRLKLYK